jgi:hypothetical protein
LLIFPFIVISFFNHPIGDDFWSADLVRRVGYFQAQSQLYQITPPRYTALAISCAGPLSFGHFFEYKLIPIIWIGLMILMIKCWIKDSWVAILFTGMYFSLLPGIGEGLFWFSAMTVYFTGLLFFIGWARALTTAYSADNLVGKRKRKIWIIVILCEIGMAGCNEIILMISLIVLATLVLYGWARQKRTDFSALFLMIMTGAGLFFLLRSAGSQHRYVLIQTPGSGNLAYSAGLSLLAVGYCIAKALINPFFWASVLVAYPFFGLLEARLSGKYNALFDAPAYFFLSLAIILWVIPFTIIFLTGRHPYFRVVNMVVFFLLIGLLYLGLWLARQRRLNSKQFMPRWLVWKPPHLIWMLLGLTIAGFVVRNNVSSATREVLSGKAYMYDKEMHQRYGRIMASAGDSCVVPHLRHISAVLRYDTFERFDQHVSDYFHKDVIIH